MYNIDFEDELPSLAGARFVQLCIGSSDLILNFERQFSISVTSDILIEEGGVKRKSILPHNRLAHSIGLVINSIGSIDKHSFYIEFEDKLKVIFFDDSFGAYESFHVKIGDNIYIV